MSPPDHAAAAVAPPATLPDLPASTREPQPRLAGMVALTDLLTARVRVLEAERRRERVLRLRLALPRRMRPAA